MGGSFANNAVFFAKATHGDSGRGRGTEGVWKQFFPCLEEEGGT